MTTPVTPDHSALIERLEKLEGSDRELGADILLACGWRSWEQEVGMVWLSPPGSQDMYLRGHVTCPDPTSSIDAALTLLKGLWCIFAMEFPSVKYLPANPDGGFMGAKEIVVQVNENIPIALCIAALKARNIP